MVFFVASFRRFGHAHSKLHHCDTRRRSWQIRPSDPQAAIPYPFNTVRRPLGGFVLPDPDNGPPHGAELTGDPGIPATVSTDFLVPPLPIPLGSMVVNWAAVPEAPVHEDGYPCRGKDYVG